MLDPCGAKTRSGGTCRSKPINGTTRCRMHGGAAPQTIKAAARRRAEVEVVEAVRTFGLRRDISPGEALLEDVQWTAGHVAWLREQVQQLEASDLTWGVSKQVDQRSGKGRKGVDTTSEARLNAMVALYQSERKHLTHVCEVTIRAGVEVKRVELAQRIGEQFVGFVRRVFADSRLALTAEQVAAAHDVVAAQLRELST